MLAPEELALAGEMAGEMLLPGVGPAWGPAAGHAGLHEAYASMNAQQEQVRIGGRSFEELLAWAWGAYERLGTLASAQSADYEFAKVAYAADVSDLGRLLMKLLLQPYKFRAAHAEAGAQAAHPPPVAQMPPADAFAPSLQKLLLRMLHPKPTRRPTAREVLDSEWACEPLPGIVRPLCVCWRMHTSMPPATHELLAASHAQEPAQLAGAPLMEAPEDSIRPRCGPSDLRLLRRRVPTLNKLNLSHANVVTDEWLEVLAAHHATSLTQLDLSACSSISASCRPLDAIRLLTNLEVLRLPAEKWREHELADALTALPRLKGVDASTHADLTRELDALRKQCEILGHAHN